MTTIPSHLLAMSHKSDTKSTQTQVVSDHDDCDHHHDGAKTYSDKATHNKNVLGEKPCCDEGVCKCLNNSCHSAIKVFGSSSIPALSLASSISQFTVIQESMTQGLPESIMRPPKA